MFRKNIKGALLVTALLATTSIGYVSAEDNETINSDQKMERSEINSNHKMMRNNYKMERDNMKSEMKDKKSEMKSDYKMKRADMRDSNIKTMKRKREEIMIIMKPYLAALPNDIQGKLSDLMEKRITIKQSRAEGKRVKMEKMKEMATNMTQEQKTDFIKQYREGEKNEKAFMKEEMNKYFAEIKNIVGDSEAGVAYLEKAKEMEARMGEERRSINNDRVQKVDEMKSDYKMKRDDMKSEMKAKRAELRIKYKEAFVKRLGDRLDKIPKEKLSKIYTVIENKISKLEANTRLSEDRKNIIIAQYEAVNELINEKLNTESDNINLEELLK